jgi:hypothetical protein
MTKMINPSMLNQALWSLANSKTSITIKVSNKHQFSRTFFTSLAVSHCRILQQGDCKNAFCQTYLPDHELTIIRPPLVTPSYANDKFCPPLKTFYGI